MNLYYEMKKRIILSVLFAICCYVSNVFAAGSMTVSSTVYKKLMQVEEQINSGKLDDAIRQSEILLNSRHINSYEKSLVYQLLAGAYIRKEKYDKATRVYKTILSLKALPESNQVNIHYSLVQLYFQLAQYDLALNHFDIWRNKTKEIRSEGWQLLASIYIAREEFQKAISPAEKALKLVRHEKESLYQMLLGLYQRTNKSHDALKLLEIILGKYPEKKEYWLQYFYTLNEIGKEKEALTILDLAYTNKLLTEEREFINLAQYHLYHQNPLRAALILEKEVKEGKINNTAETLKLLASAWFNAREYQSALSPLKQSAELSGDGETYYQLAQAFSELNLWNQSIESLKRALDDKTIKNPGACYLLMGIAFTELDEYARAEQAFNQSLLDQKTQDEAQRWILYLGELEK